MTDLTDEIVVLHADLQRLHQVLNTTYNFMLAQDLVKQYAALRTRPTESALTKEIKAARDRVGGYLASALIEVEVLEDDEE